MFGENHYSKKYQSFFQSISQKFDIRKLLSKFETHEAKCIERKTRIKLLIKSGSPHDIAIAKMLKRCRKKRRCWSAACPVCMRCYRRRYIGFILGLFSSYKSIYVVTIVPPIYLLEPYDLYSASLANLKMMLRAQLNSAGFKGCIIIGGCELVFDHNLQKYILHFHLVMGDYPDSAMKELRRIYANQNKDEGITKPIVVQRLRNPAKQISYTLKSWAGQRGIDKDAQYVPGKATRLKEPYHTQSMRFFARHEPQEFAFMYGCTQRGAKIYSTLKKPLKELKF